MLFKVTSTYGHNLLNTGMYYLDLLHIVVVKLTLKTFNITYHEKEQMGFRGFAPVFVLLKYLIYFIGYFFCLYLPVFGGFVFFQGIELCYVKFNNEFDMSL